MMIRDTKAHCVNKSKHQTIYKMVDYDKLIQVDKKRALTQQKLAIKEDSLNNGYHDGNIGLNHRQGLTEPVPIYREVSVKLICYI